MFVENSAKHPDKTPWGDMSPLQGYDWFLNKFYKHFAPTVLFNDHSTSIQKTIGCNLF
jgi:hypothetical protein